MSTTQDPSKLATRDQIAKARQPIARKNHNEQKQEDIDQKRISIQQH
jgi:hypothetical protein